MDAPDQQRGAIHALAVRLRAEYGEKAAKYLAVTAVNIVVGQGLLVFCNAVLGWGYVPSNVTAVSISALPAFVLYRRWVWGMGGKSHLTREVLPFWAIAFVGLLLSSAAVWVAEQFSDRTIVLQLANVSAFGVLWVAKFFFLDKMLFDVADHLVHEDAVETAG